MVYTVEKGANALPEFRNMRIWPRRQSKKEWQQAWLETQRHALKRAIEAAKTDGDQGHVQVLEERLRRINREERELLAGLDER